jgi:ATP-dependent Zn protease
VISSDDIFRENGFIYAPIYETDEPAVYYYFVYGYDTLPVNTISGDINEQAKGASPMFIFGILGFIIFVLLIIVFFFFKRRLFYDKKTGSEKQKHKEKTKK